MSDNNFFGPLGNPAFNIDLTAQRAEIDHPAYNEVNDSATDFYPMSAVTLPPAPDVPPEGDRYAYALWDDVVSSYRWYSFIPWGYGATNAPVFTEQDNMRIGRSLVNPLPDVR